MSTGQKSSAAGWQVNTVRFMAKSGDINGRAFQANVFMANPAGGRAILVASQWFSAPLNGWQDFQFFNPMTKKIEPKEMYWEKHDNMVFAAGAYKPE